MNQIDIWLQQVEDRLAVLAYLVSSDLKDATEVVVAQYRETLRELAKR